MTVRFFPRIRGARLKLSSLPRPTRWLLGGFLAAGGAVYCRSPPAGVYPGDVANSLLPDFRELDHSRPGKAGQLPRTFAGSDRRPHESHGDHAVGVHRPVDRLAVTHSAYDGGRKNGPGGPARRGTSGCARLGSFGARPEAYEADDFRVGGTIDAHPITAEYLVTNQQPPARAQGRVQKKSIDLREPLCDLPR